MDQKTAMKRYSPLLNRTRRRISGYATAQESDDRLNAASAQPETGAGSLVGLWTSGWVGLEPSGRDCEGVAVRDRTLSPIWVLSSTVTLPGAVYASGRPAKAFYARLDARNITLDGFT